MQCCSSWSCSALACHALWEVKRATFLCKKRLHENRMLSLFGVGALFSLKANSDNKSCSARIDHPYQPPHHRPTISGEALTKIK
eukprot:scaffold488_cov109-Skeletonema_dohrnii-CCMP3373.AAC.4